MSRRSTSGGFTLVELIVIVLLIVLIIWGVRHCFGGKQELRASPRTQEESNEDSNKKVAKIILVGLLMCGGIAWQVYLISEHDDRDGPVRVIPAAVAAGVLFLGVFVVSLIELLDDRKSTSLGLAAANVGRVALLGVSLVVKSYLAPLTAAFTLSCVVYFFFTYGELRVIPFVQGVFDWAFSGGPKWVSWTYTAVVSTYALGAAIHDSDLHL
jgi:hypothetical protein